jgi:hypothetical protein
VELLFPSVEPGMPTEIGIEPHESKFHVHQLLSQCSYRAITKRHRTRLFELRVIVGYLEARIQQQDQNIGRVEIAGIWLGLDGAARDRDHQKPTTINIPESPLAFRRRSRHGEPARSSGWANVGPVRSRSLQNSVRAFVTPLLCRNSGELGRLNRKPPSQHSRSGIFVSDPVSLSHRVRRSS